MEAKQQIRVWGLCSLWGVIILVGIVTLQEMQRRNLFQAEGEALATQARLQERQYESQLRLLQRMPDLGFRNLVADWTFLQYLQYFGNREHRQITGYGLSGDFFEIIIDRDPYAYDPYIFLSSSLTLYAGQPERAVELQAKGLESLTPELPPESYFIWRSKGVDEMLFLGDFEAASQSHTTAAEWAAQSPNPQAQADQDSLRQTAAFLQTEPDNPRVRVGAWQQILASAPDQPTQAIAIQNIEALGYEVVPREGGGYSIQPRSSAAEP